MQEAYTLRQLVERLQNMGYQITESAVDNAKSRGKVNLRPYIVPGLRKNGFICYRLEALDEIARYCKERDARREELARNKKHTRDRTPLLTKSQPPEVVERRLRELKQRWPNDDERLYVWLNALVRMGEEHGPLIERAVPFTEVTKRRKAS